MNAYADYVVNHLFAQSWQIALLTGVVGLLSFVLRNRSAHIRYLLWLVVLAKCFVPPVLTVPVAVLPQRPSAPLVGGFNLAEEYSAPEAHVLFNADPKPPDPAPAILSARESVALVWTAGVVGFLLWVGGRAVRYTAWLRDRRRPLPPVLQNAVQELSLGFHFRNWPRIWLLDDISQPFVWGLLRGSVYLPADFVAGSPSGQWRSIVAHELSHVARFDAGFNLLQVLAQAVYWFHPFVWWTNRKIRQEREKCCDEVAVAHLHTPPEDYTGAIVDTLAAERRSTHPIPSLAIVGSARDIEERIKTMLRPGKTFRKHPSLVAVTIALLIALVTIPTALVLTARGQTPPTAARVDKLPATPPKGEALDRPRYTARSFNSKMALDVFVQGGPTLGYSGFGRPIGRTPSVAPLEIPSCWLWFVRPAVPVEDWDLLIREMSQNDVPGLRLREDAPASDLRHLAHLGGLRFLDLTRVEATDASLAPLVSLTELWGLNLWGREITGPGLEHLKGLSGLEFLSLMGTSVNDSGLQYLKELKALRQLNLWGTQITDAGLIHLKGLSGLQQLNLNDTKITGGGLGCLKGMSGLQRLSLRYTQVTDADLVHLAGLTELWGLDFIGTEITGPGLEHLKGLTKLRQVNLTNTKLADSGLAHLASLTELQRLWLAETPITDAGLAHLKSLPGLQELVVRGTQITDAGLVHLKAMAGLQHVGLGVTQITDAGLANLDGLIGLHGLWLQDTKITDAGLACLKDLTSLSNLNLDGTRITDVGLVYLKGLIGLQDLRLGRTQITSVGLQHLKGMIRLERLELSGTKIADAGLEHLKNFAALQYLDLSGTQVTDAGVQQLNQSLPNLTIAR